MYEFCVSTFIICCDFSCSSKLNNKLQPLGFVVWFELQEHPILQCLCQFFAHDSICFANSRLVGSLASACSAVHIMVISNLEFISLQALFKICYMAAVYFEFLLLVLWIC